MVSDVVVYGEPISCRHAPWHRLGPSRQREDGYYAANGGGRHVAAVGRLPALGAGFCW